MTDAELAEAIDGLLAYDVGCTDSGIHDEDLRARVRAELRKPEARGRLIDLVRRPIFAQTPQDRDELWGWLEDQAGVNFARPSC